MDQFLSQNIPQVQFAHIGGSATWNCCFPEDLKIPGIRVLQDNLQFDTPFGRSAPFQLIEIDGGLTSDGNPRSFLDVVFHGWNGLSPYDDRPAERIFWVFQQANVKLIISDGTVGSINPLLEVGDVVIASDVIDYTKRYSCVGYFAEDIVDSDTIVSPYLAGVLREEAEQKFRRVFSKGTYGVYECPRLQTPSEARRFYDDHCDIIGHTMMPEAILARAIGSVYAGIYLVSAETGLFRPASNLWCDKTLDMGEVVVKAMAAVNLERTEDVTEHIIMLQEAVRERITFSE